MKRVIIAEDDAFLRQLMGEYLLARGYTVAAYAGGDDACAAAQKWHPDILITDIMMEDGEGISTIRDVRDEQPGIRIIAVSSNERYLRYARSLGADRVLQKPIKCTDLLRAVEMFEEETPA